MRESGAAQTARFPASLRPAQAGCNGQTRLRSAHVAMNPLMIADTRAQPRRVLHATIHFIRLVAVEELQCVVGRCEVRPVHECHASGR
jgi:hypothetical protein